MLNKFTINFCSASSSLLGVHLTTCKEFQCQACQPSEPRTHAEQLPYSRWMTDCKALQSGELGYWLKLMCIADMCSGTVQRDHSGEVGSCIFQDLQQLSNVAPSLGTPADCPLYTKYKCLAHLLLSGLNIQHNT